MKKLLLLLVVGGFMFTSCTYRLVDFTTISTKNVYLAGLKKSEGKKVKATKGYFLGLGWNIKDGIDKALEQAGPEYDLLVDGVVRMTSLPFITEIKVEGIAVSSEKMKVSLGEEGFKNWLKGHKVATADNMVVEE